jgi:ELWxxDGT repeat protein
MHRSIFPLFLSGFAGLTTSVAAQTSLTQLGAWTCTNEPIVSVDLFGITVFLMGTELWRTDGTGAGTYRLTTLTFTTAGPRQLVRMGDHVFFTNFDTPTGEELWRTDGTVAGTGIVRDYLPGVTSTIVPPASLTAFGRYLLFRGQTPPSGGIEPFVSDGTFAGTYQLLDLMPGANGSSPSSFAALGDRAVFLANDGVHGSEFWVTDGTPSGTSLVTDLTPGPSGTFASLAGVVAGRAWYVLGIYPNLQLLVTDGTAAGTQVLRAWSAQPAPAQRLSAFVELGGRAYFCVEFYSSLTSSTSNELWSSDGTIAGTQSLGLLWPSNYSPGNVTPRLWPVGSRFLCERGTALGLEPWIFDPSTNAFAIVQDFAAGSGSSRIDQVAPLQNGLAAVTIAIGSTPDLWSVDMSGTTPPVLLHLRAESLMPIGARQAWFAGENGNEGYELWRTDGTLAGTQRVGAEVFVGTHGLRVDAHCVSGGRLLVFGQERLSVNTYVCAPRLWAIEPGAHTLRLGDPGAAGMGAMQLSGDDPVLGTTAALQLRGLGGVGVTAMTLDFFSTRPYWLDPVWFYSGLVAPQVLQLGFAPPDPWVVAQAIPATPSLAGLRLVAQGFGFDTAGLRASNGLLLVVGN